MTSADSRSGVDNAATRGAVENRSDPAPGTSFDRRSAGQSFIQRTLGNQIVQRAAASASAPDRIEPGVEQEIKARCGGGAALPEPTRRTMEQAFGANFSNVRIHSGAGSHDLNQSLSARAFTSGSDIFFSRGAYNPNSRAGQRLIAHELTHVLQQTGGAPAPAVQGKLTLGPADDVFERQADRAAEAALQGCVTPVTTGALSHSAARTVQRMIGFEFETLDLIVRAPGNTVVLHDPIVEGDGWGLYLDSMSPDEIGYGELDTNLSTVGHVEFVTEAFEESTKGRERMLAVMADMIAFIDRLSENSGELQRRVAGQPDGKRHLFRGAPKQKKVKFNGVKLADLLSDLQDEPGGSEKSASGSAKEEKPELPDRIVGWNEKLSGQSDEKLGAIVIERLGPEGRVHATPQVTAGIKLGALQDHLSEMQAGGFLSALPKASQNGFQHGYDSIVSDAQNLDTLTVEVPEPGLSPLQKKEYAGAIAQLAHIVVRTDQSVSMPKAVSPLLSRTNYGHLPDFIRKHSNFRNDVIALAAKSLKKDEAHFAKRPFMTVDGASDGRTVQDWLNEIVAGNDTTRWGQRDRPERWTPQPVGRKKNRGWGTVYEMRGFANGYPYKGLGERSNWTTFAETNFDHFRGLNHDVKTVDVNLASYGQRYGGEPQPGAVPSVPPDLGSGSGPLPNPGDENLVAVVVPQKVRSKSGQVFSVDVNLAHDGQQNVNLVADAGGEPSGWGQMSMDGFLQLIADGDVAGID